MAFSSAGWTGISARSLRSGGIEEAAFNLVFDTGLLVVDGEVFDFFFEIVGFGWICAWSFDAFVEPLDFVGNGGVGAGC